MTKTDLRRVRVATTNAARGARAAALMMGPNAGDLAVAVRTAYTRLGPFTVRVRYERGSYRVELAYQGYKICQNVTCQTVREAARFLAFAADSAVMMVADHLLAQERLERAGFVVLNK